MMSIVDAYIFLPFKENMFGVIAKLMDSIMLGYPIGTFLFWKVKKDTINKKEYSMYEFIKDYHKRDLYKNPAVPQPFLVGSDDETL